MARSRFRAFPQSTLDFLHELSANNERDWFQANKARYDADVLEPAFAFIEAMQGPLAKISPHYQAIPKRQGGSLMRVYRDVRFSRDKRPYKTNIGIQFRHEAARDVHAPGFYVHVAPHEVFIGAGAWRPDPGALAAIRTRIAERPDEWRAIRDARAFRRVWELGGESLRRAPRGFDPQHPLVDELKRKDFIGTRQLDELAPLDPAFFDDVVKCLRAAGPLMAFLCKAQDLPF